MLSLAIGSEEDSVAFYLKSETDSYYFSLATWNSITKEYLNNYVSAIRHNVVANGRSMGLIIIIKIICAKLDCHIATKTKYRTGLNAAPDMIIHLSNIKSKILKFEEKRQKHSSHYQNITLLASSMVTREHM